MPQEIPSSIKELKAFISSAGLSFNDCISKADLVSRAKEASERLSPSATKGTVPSSMVLAGFECTTFVTGDPTKKINSIALILHGLGATNSDFEFLGKEPKFANTRCLMIFPQAPRNGMIPSWWDLDPQQLISNFSNPQYLATFLRQEPNKFVANRNSLLKLIDEALALELDIVERPKLLLGGFSQGAITSTDLCLHLEPKFEKIGLLIMSGAPMMVDAWNAKMDTLAKEGRNIDVFLTHGQSDMVLPFISYTWLRDMLMKYSDTLFTITTSEHSGGHDIGGPDNMNKIFGFIHSIIS